MRAAAEFAVHRVDAQFDGDLDGAFPVADGGLTFILIVRCPPIHRQQRGNADIGVRQGTLEGFHPIGKNARRLEPFQEIGARAEFDPLIAQFGHFRGQLFQRQVTVHERVEGDFHLIHFPEAIEPPALLRRQMSRFV